MRRIAVMSLVLSTLLTAAGPAAARTASTRAGCALPTYGPGSSYHPTIDASRFGPDVTNPWFPLRPGTTFVYQGSEDEDTLVDVFVPSHRTKVVDGVRTRVVNDRLYRNGVLAERTTDYYAQDVCGNVWYFGEDTAELDAHGRVVSTDGTWQAGRRGAQPGVYLPAHPQLGRPFRQEWAAGTAEDQFVAVARNTIVRTPYVDSRRTLTTHETTALEPGVLDQKVYVYGVGEVVERTLKGGSELLRLVDVLR